VISRITGRLVHLTETAATIDVGMLQYEVYVPEFVRRQLQALLGNEVSLRTIQYLEGNPQQGRLTPRIIGFMKDAEKEFFELICSVDGVGTKKALRAMVRPVQEVAEAIEEQDIKQLSTLPGVGPAVAERIVAKLRRKMAKFALIVGHELPEEEARARDLFNDVYEALLSLGHSTSDARQRVDALAQSGKRFRNVQEMLNEIYQQSRHPGAEP
jgi:Holliday junction DNA helicase RuvA